ncbi:MAG: helix-turn-helix domain-containing protein, partial [Halioglobus sp.]|nr:helix-turn-helix domain-containing protein [Halioglobus sp.]
GTQLNVAAHGPLGFAALSAPTLGDAMDVMGDLATCRNTATTMSMRASETHYALLLADATGDEEFHNWLAEVVLKIVEILLATIIGHPVGKIVLVSFSLDAGERAQALRESFDGTVQFGCEETAIAVPLAWRQLPSPLYDESVYRANLIECREMIAAREQAESLVHDITNRLRNHFDAQCSPGAAPASPPTLEELAERLHMTPRTLIRRLKREDASYRELLETLRREYAERLLRDARLTAADVGQVLGYQEAANFGRAFRRWYGQSPAAWRRSG